MRLMTMTELHHRNSNELASLAAEAALTMKRTKPGDAAYSAAAATLQNIRTVLTHRNRGPRA